jgi:hypothetical protein
MAKLFESQDAGKIAGKHEVFSEGVMPGMWQSGLHLYSPSHGFML